MNLTGGTISTVNNTYAGEQTNGVLNVSGTGHLIVGTSGVAGLALIPAVTNATTLGIVNLLPGGLITTPQVHQGQGQGIINFQGGVLQASTDHCRVYDSDRVHRHVEGLCISGECSDRHQWVHACLWTNPLVLPPAKA